MAPRCSNRHRLRGLLVAAVVLWLTGCDAAPESSQPQSTARTADEAAEWAASRRTDSDAGADDAPEDDADPDGPSPGAEEFPCTVLGLTAIEQLLGNPVEPPAWTLEEVEDQGVSFQAETCSWLTFEQAAGEIVLQVSWPDQFEQGAVVCWQPESVQTEGSDAATGQPADLTPLSEEADDDEPAPEPKAELVADLGSAAWWLYDLDSEFGSLQVCHPRVRVAVEVSSVSDAAARAAAVDLARRTLSALPR